MEVLLAGFNLDRELISKLGAAAESAAQSASRGPTRDAPQTTDLDPAALTPETLSAAYARISRDPRPIPELRAEARADVAAARRSNRRIVFGFGHLSVAEHAIFNLDILGISRLAIEALEATRLGSYTEKSQRYILLDRDFFIPEELAGGPLEQPLRELITAQQEGYRKAQQALAAHYEATEPERWATRQGRRDLEGAALEDARYFLGLTTTGQVGVTMNARNLEATIRRLAAEPLAEVRELGRRLHEVVAPVAPSLIRHTEPTPHRRDTPAALATHVDPAEGSRTGVKGSTSGAEGAAGAENAARPAVRLLACPADAEEKLLAALLHGCSTLSWDAARQQVAAMEPEARAALLRESLGRMDEHEAPLRAFELPQLLFELTVSASCFAQLKRHRMATLLPQPYDPALGVTEPPAFAALNLSAQHARIRDASETLAARIAREQPAAAAYALTNAHRRRVLFQANARELYHFARLRLDAHAQWDIRALAEEMIAEARRALPGVMCLACGRDRFGAEHARLFGAPSPAEE